MPMSSRARSHWGWGWADKFLPTAQRQAFGATVGSMLGFKGLTPSEPVPLVDATVATSRITIPAALASLISEDEADRATHTYGRGFRDLVRGFQGDFGGAPDAVAHPRAEADIQRVLDWAADAGVAVVPYGGGTSVVGGVEGPRERGPWLSLDMRGHNRVLEIDEESRSAYIEAGATGPVLEAQLAERGYSLRHFPQSFEFSTLGGWIATRAGGHFATVYTHIDDLVASTRTVTPRGIMESRRLPGSGAGPSPDRLIIGSEGTLGVISAAWMRLHDRPIWRTKANVLFTDYADAVRATRQVAQSGLYPTNCRLLDKREAMLNMLPTRGQHVLLLGFESADHPLEPWLSRAVAIAEGCGGICPEGPQYSERAPKSDRSASQSAAESWRASFLEGPYLQNTLVSLGVVVDTFETACTWDRFDELHGQVVSSVRGIMKRLGGGHLSCRFTHVYPDGPAPYYTFLTKAPPGDALAVHAELKAAASDALIANGATITHHHAVGRLHRPWYDRQRPDLFATAFRAAKKALDPAGIMNPGVLVDVD